MEPPTEIEFNGKIYKRYPDSVARSHRVYYVQGTAPKARTYLHRDIWEYHNGPIPDDYDVHHIDGDSFNNTIENLTLMKHGEHSNLHFSEWYAENKEKQLAHLENVRPLTVEWHRSEEGRTWHKEHWQKTIGRIIEKKEFICLNCLNQFTSRTSMKSVKFCSEKCGERYRWRTQLDTDRSCEICGAPFKAYKKSKRKTCSSKCRYTLMHRNR